MSAARKPVYAMTVAELEAELAKAKRARNCLPQDITYWRGWIAARKGEPLTEALAPKVHPSPLSVSHSTPPSPLEARVA